MKRAHTRLARSFPAALLVAGLLVTARLLAAGPAKAEALVTSLSSHQVAITSNYAGSQVVLFGVVQRDAQTIARTTGYEVAITVRGPRQTLTVRQKEALGPIWLNREQQKFAAVPAYLAVVSSAPLEEVTTDILRRRFRLGLDETLKETTSGADEGDDRFLEALLRLRAREGLFFQVERGVTFITPNIFRAVMPLPAAAPPGEYDVDVMLFSDDILLARDRTNFELVKIGFEQRIAELAEFNPALYGGATAAFALLFGWLASVIFRRD